MEPNFAFLGNSGLEFASTLLAYRSLLFLFAEAFPLLPALPGPVDLRAVTADIQPVRYGLLTICHLWTAKTSVFFFFFFGKHFFCTPMQNTHSSVKGGGKKQYLRPRKGKSSLLEARKRAKQLSLLKSHYVFYSAR